MECLRQDAEMTSEAEWRQFRYMLFAMHPDRASVLLEAVDEAKEKQENLGGLDEFAHELTDEEMAEYVPFSHEEVEATIGLLRHFGVVMTDGDD